MYPNPDGSGRDTHAFHIQFDEHARYLTHLDRSRLAKLKAGFTAPPKIRVQGASCGAERIPIYAADGSGRDGYIHSTNAGLIPRHKPYRFGTDLR